ncbi:Hypp7805 [Branchiostoma lanceolatum]|uniref:Hypp7805 protein n=1 Tax=Branchiostoma lanceolatum TaxID=7740 RepID=A0A8K0EFH9_BRALA|nr:Hypp7805 [Branchiostoma lanceolatum]
MGNASAKGAKPLDLTVIDDPQDKDLGNYDFPFENLVIEGGGARGVAYIGALRVLETAGILQNIKRVSGVSAGAITATFVALGLSCADVAEQATVDMSKILISGGYLRTLIKPVQLFRRYGWESGKGFYKYFGSILEKFTRKGDQPGNPDITFKQLYKMRGIELCIVVTNLDQQTEEYCHVKTTPDLPIRKAVRMSMSIPGLFQPVVTDYHGDKDFYVDGGVVCNYPLHSFDGWWLSMNEEDSFFNRLVDLSNLTKALHRSERFEPMNPKTIGLMLYADDDVEIFQQEFCDRLTQEEREYEKHRPDTEAARAYTDKRKMETVDAMENRKKMRTLIDKFLTSLKSQNTDHNATISRAELRRAFQEAGTMSLTDQEKKKLFGEGHYADQLFDQMDADKDGQLTYQEVHEFFGNKGFHWLTRCLGGRREQSTSLKDYTMKYMDLLGVLGKKVYCKALDVDRSIGVDSDYVKTTDFTLESEDKIFLFKRGASGARAFLRTYISKNELQPTATATELRRRSSVLFAPYILAMKTIRQLKHKKSTSYPVEVSTLRTMGSVYTKEVEKKPLDLTAIDDPQDKDFGNYDLPFENLVIEGGGARGFAYIGALRVLESAGILKNIKRIGGVSAGSMIATYVALGLGPAEVAEVTNTDMSKVVAEGGYLKALMKPFNLYWRYGWETGNGFNIWFGNIVERFTRKGDQPGNPDITFKQLYEMTGKELCVVVSNLSDMTEEYCHVKTTPNLPIRKAVRMSMSIPGLFQPEQSDHFGDNRDFYVDGAVVCNYPLHCFDGWWLSMDEENSFFNRVDDLLNLSDTMHRSNRFEPANPKTVGLMLYYDGEPFQKTFLEWLTKEEREYTMNRPNTALARAYKDKVKLETVEAMEHRKKMHSLIAKFLQTLKKNQIDDLTTISREELYQVFEEVFYIELRS